MADRQSTDPFSGKAAQHGLAGSSQRDPERSLDPSGFVTTCSPAARAASAMIRVVAVFPFVPVTRAQPWL